jgi:hypothetical protein
VPGIETTPLLLLTDDIVEVTWPTAPKEAHQVVAEATRQIKWIDEEII